MALWQTPTNVTGFSSLVNYINYATGNMFGVLILIAIFFVAFLTISVTYRPKEAFIVSSFICFVLSVLMRAANWIGDLIMFLFVALLAIAAVFLLVKKDSYY